MKNLIITLLALSAFISISCKNIERATGNTIVQNKNISTFNAVINDISADVIIHVDANAITSTCIVEAQQKVLDNIVLDNKNNELIITYPKGKYIESTKPIKITLTTNSLEKIKLLGSGNITADGTNTNNNMLCALMGSGAINISNTTTNMLKLELAGSGEIIAKGCTALNGEYALKGSGDIKAIESVCGNLKGQITGSGDISATVGESLDASITGSGDFNYKGEPKKLVQNITGSGSINKK